MLLPSIKPARLAVGLRLEVSYVTEHHLPLYDAPLFLMRNVGSPVLPLSMFSANTREQLRQLNCQHKRSYDSKHKDGVKGL
jgi:hypothetical protein